jgi:hypothetical protein
MRQRDILFFWLPLFASWLLMTFEGPTITATTNRLPNEVIMLAAQGIVISLSVTLESPIINLLATSTALVKDRSSYLLIRKFTVHWMILLTLITVALAFTPLFDLVIVDLMGITPEVSVWVRPGLQIMTFWSAAIGWRRFQQGVLIHFKQTKKITYGTVIRLFASGGTVIGLAIWGEWPGVYIGTTAWMSGVLAEAIYATIAVRPLLKNQLAENSPAAAGPALTYKDLFWFHLPLAGTSLLVLLVQPLVAFSLARLDQPTQSLAAWPIVFQITLISRAAAFALPEVVIAISEGEQTFRPIRRFTFILTAVITLFMAIVILTPLANVYLFNIQDMTQPVGDLARSGLALFIPLPGLAVLLSWIRGLLINQRKTKFVNVGMGINVVATVIVLAIGMYFKWPGISTAALALTVASIFELIYLLFRIRNLLDFQFTLFDSPQQAIAASGSN